MILTRQDVADRIGAYLHHEITPGELADWAEQALLEGNLDSGSDAVLSAVLARMGVADVRAFSLAWEDCEDLLRQLGYAARVEIVAG